jgi:hypothetical protein
LASYWPPLKKLSVMQRIFIARHQGHPLLPCSFPDAVPDDGPDDPDPCKIPGPQFPPIHWRVKQNKKPLNLCDTILLQILYRSHDYGKLTPTHRIHTVVPKVQKPFAVHRQPLVSALIWTYTEVLSSFSYGHGHGSRTATIYFSNILRRKMNNQ